MDKWTIGSKGYQMKGKVYVHHCIGLMHMAPAIHVLRTQHSQKVAVFEHLDRTFFPICHTRAWRSFYGIQFHMSIERPGAGPRNGLMGMIHHQKGAQSIAWC